MQKTLDAFPGAEVTCVRNVLERDAALKSEDHMSTAPYDYLSSKYKDGETELTNFDPDDSDEDYI